MRMFLKASWQIEGGNVAIKAGILPETMESILAELKPEAAYFIAENGTRTAHIYFDLKDPSQLPAVAEPWFLAFNAKVEVTPAMTAEDLKKGGPGIEAAVKRYGRIQETVGTLR
ncbi:MAG: hypothetical protein A2W29_10545 [Gemmatimonadetes bacterium RBG_16_66_8]|nr:MAG: hypothetical protein A2W29_10545 [Gemmatimonadetes bacterium RBG_16_66_8]